MKINHRRGLNINDRFDNRHKTKYSHRCEKMSYDKKGAITAKNKRYHEDHIKLREYYCGRCNAWHLTKIVEWDSDYHKRVKYT